MAEAGKANWAVGTRSIGVTGGLRAAVQQSGIATRRLGELMEAQRKTVGLAKAGRPAKIGLSKNPNITLAEIGVDKHLADKARKFAALPKERA